ncbi:MAG: toll/interleukin-1 receptor domain-containing protein, partial [Dehalococcoidia bacterium]
MVYRSTPAPSSTTPLDVELNDAETSAIVMLIDENWANDPGWVAWAKALTERTEAAGLSARAFPVAIDAG